MLTMKSTKKSERWFTGKYYRLSVFGNYFINLLLLGTFGFFNVHNPRAFFNEINTVNKFTYIVGNLILRRVIVSQD